MYTKHIKISVHIHCNVWDFCVIRTMHVAYVVAVHTPIIQCSTNIHTQNECALERRLFVKFCMHFTCISHDKWKPDLVSVVNTHFDVYGTHTTLHVCTQYTSSMCSSIESSHSLLRPHSVYMMLFPFTSAGLPIIVAFNSALWCGCVLHVPHLLCVHFCCDNVHR